MDIVLRKLANYINSLIVDNHQKNIVLEFHIIQNVLFLITEYKAGSDNNMNDKSSLYIDLDDLSMFYIKLYEIIKQQYIFNNHLKVKIEEIKDFSNLNNPYLSFKIHDVHLNEIDIRFRNFGHEKEAIDSIEEDLLLLYQEKTSKSM